MVRLANLHLVRSAYTYTHLIPKDLHICTRLTQSYAPSACLGLLWHRLASQLVMPDFFIT